jgi:glycosyltransferase involved in cell wall biosynthesis
MVRFLGRVADEDLPALYSGAGKRFSTRHFTKDSDSPPLGAMACGTPVIVSEAASLPEVVGEAGPLR